MSIIFIRAQSIKNYQTILKNHKFEYDENEFTNIYTISQYHTNIMSSNIFYYIEKLSF